MTTSLCVLRYDYIKYGSYVRLVHFTDIGIPADAAVGGRIIESAET
mgnify:CR=1 FL=1